MAESLRLSEGILSKMQAHARRAYPQECCGILFGDRECLCVKDICITENRREKEYGKGHFLIDPLELYEAEKKADEEKTELIGFYHSHPDHPAQPSIEDEENMIPELIYVIVSMAEGECQDVKGYRKRKMDGGAFAIHIDYYTDY